MSSSIHSFVANGQPQLPSRFSDSWHAKTNIEVKCETSETGHRDGGRSQPSVSKYVVCTGVTTGGCSGNHGEDNGVHLTSGGGQATKPRLETVWIKEVRSNPSGEHRCPGGTIQLIKSGIKDESETKTGPSVKTSGNWDNGQATQPRLDIEPETDEESVPNLEIKSEDGFEPDWGHSGKRWRNQRSYNDYQKRKRRTNRTTA